MRIRLGGLFILFMIWIIFYAKAQVRCGVANDLPETTQQFESWLKSRKIPNQNNQKAERSESLIQIPVVFHVIHNGEAIGTGSNVTEAKIIEQLDILNQDYRRLNQDQDLTPTEFLNVAADTEMTFIMAKQDAEGLPTDGIVRVQGSKQNFGFSEQNLLYSQSYWPSEDYLNIYIADLTGYLGWASFPFSDLPGITDINNNRLVDAVAIDYVYLGNNPNAANFESYGRTLTHEIGHFFGLRHLWGDENGCGSDDYCDDTPLQSASYDSQCPSEAVNSCSSNDMYSNYMNYTDDACMNIFTSNQKERMRIVLENSPRRKSLINSNGLFNPIIYNNDLGIMYISDFNLKICSDVITPLIVVRNYGKNVIESATIEVYLNEVLIETIEKSLVLEPLDTSLFLFGEIANSESSYDQLQFQITKVNGVVDDNTHNDSKSAFLNRTKNALPSLIDFETADVATFQLENSATSNWIKTTAPNSNSCNLAISIDFTKDSSAFGLFDYVRLPAIDLTNNGAAQISFNYAYQSTGTNYQQDGLILALSMDCGRNFYSENYLFQAYGEALSTTSTQSNAFFIPKSDADWNTVTVNLNDYLGLDKLSIAFIAQSSLASQLYLDDIIIEKTAFLDYDLAIGQVSGIPIVSCGETIDLQVQIHNLGKSTVNDLLLNYQLNGTSTQQTFSNQMMKTGDSYLYDLAIVNSQPGTNKLFIWISDLNGNTDENSTNDTIGKSFAQNIDLFELPMRVDFQESQDWLTLNPSNGANWLLTNESMAALAYQNIAIGDQSWLISPILNSSYMDHLALTFEYSYKKMIGKTDRLQVLLSTDCGDNFDHIIFDRSSNELSQDNENNFFIPSQEADWQKVFLNLTDYLIYEEFRIAFVFTNGNGNNLYLDNVEFSNKTSIDQPIFQVLMEHYPNPASGSLYLSFNLPIKENIHVQLSDLTGQIHQSITYQALLNHIIKLDVSGLSGLFLLSVNGQNFSINKKVILIN
jgi:hypothetical protein